jgi:diguanylate cyclase
MTEFKNAAGQQNTASATESRENAVKFARLILPMMSKHNIPPTPQNYAVWYAYVSSGNRALMREIDGIVQGNHVFTDDVNDYLYDKFLSQNAGRQALDDTAAAIQGVLGSLLTVLTQVSGDAASYKDSLDVQVNHLAEQLSHPELKLLVQEILEKAREVQAKGGQLQAKLGQSREEVESLSRNLEQLMQESQKDFLTGVGNRRAFNGTIGEAMEIAKHKKSELSLLMVDIDHFKKFNDRFGHLIGDEVLKAVARTLRESVRGKDFIARYGGEEFAVILPDTPLSGAMVVAENIRRNIAESGLIRRDTGENYGTITVSIGVAVLKIASDTVTTFIKRADDALYRSKKGGRNKVTQESNS